MSHHCPQFNISVFCLFVLFSLVDARATVWKFLSWQESIPWAEERPRPLHTEDLDASDSGFDPKHRQSHQWLGSSAKAGTPGNTWRTLQVTPQPSPEHKAPSNNNGSWGVPVQDVDLGRLLLQHQNCQAELADHGKDRGSRERLAGGLLPSQLHRRGQRVHQPGASGQRGGVRPGAPERGQPQRIQDVQLQGGLREDGAQQEGDAVQLRPVQDLCPGADAEPRHLDVLQALPGRLRLCVLLQHRLQAGSEGLSRSRLPASRDAPARRVRVSGSGLIKRALPDTWKVQQSLDRKVEPSVFCPHSQTPPPPLYFYSLYTGDRGFIW